jgi:hypothetical protein
VLRTDSDGANYIRFNATVNGVADSEVAWYGEDNLYECANGYQVLPTETPGCFVTPDTLLPGTQLAAWQITYERGADGVTPQTSAADQQTDTQPYGVSDDGLSYTNGIFTIRVPDSWAGHVTFTEINDMGQQKDVENSSKIVTYNVIDVYVENTADDSLSFAVTLWSPICHYYADAYVERIGLLVVDGNAYDITYVNTNIIPREQYEEELTYVTLNSEPPTSEGQTATADADK